MFQKEIFIEPLWQLIKAFEMAKNGRPKIKGIWLIGFVTGYVSRMIKSTGSMNCPTRMSTSSVSPTGFLNGTIDELKRNFCGFELT